MRTSWRLLPPLFIAACVAAPTASADERDAVIRDLLRRVQTLEERIDRPTPSPVAQPSGAPASPASEPSRTTASAPAQQDDDPVRALERALTRQGGLVLPPGAIELEPRIDYSYRSTDALTIATIGGQSQVANQTWRRHRAEASLGIRAGVPRGSQVEIRLPYARVADERVVAGLNQDVQHGGIGDIELGYTKELLQERASRVGVLGAFNWKIPTGDYRVGASSVGGGFHTLQAGLTAIKRQDPLVFFGTLSYAAIRERSYDGLRIAPGNVWGVRNGVILAASPETALRGGFEITRAGPTTVDNREIPGGHPVAGSLQFGFASLLSRRTLLDVQLAVGVTRDAPDFRLTAALPIRLE